MVTKEFRFGNSGGRTVSLDFLTESGLLEAFNALPALETLYRVGPVVVVAAKQANGVLTVLDKAGFKAI